MSHGQASEHRLLYFSPAEVRSRSCQYRKDPRSPNTHLQTRWLHLTCVAKNARPTLVKDGGLDELSFCRQQQSEHVGASQRQIEWRKVGRCGGWSTLR